MATALYLNTNVSRYVFILHVSNVRIYMSYLCRLLIISLLNPPCSSSIFILLIILNLQISLFGSMLWNRCVGVYGSTIRSMVSMTTPSTPIWKRRWRCSCQLLKILCKSNLNGLLLTWYGITRTPVQCMVGMRNYSDMQTFLIKNGYNLIYCAFHLPKGANASHLAPLDVKKIR
jgi:hypothetical protein